MASNQIHYKYLKGQCEKEYEDVLGAKSYVEALIWARFKSLEGESMEIKKYEWQTVSRRKVKNIKAKASATIFVAKIPVKAKTVEIWNFFKKEG